MRDAVICEPVRTPVGGFGGSLRDVSAHALAATVIRALLERTGLAPEAVDDVILGHCYPTMDAPAIGRVAALDAGLPVTVTGLQIDRRCGSGLQAVLYAAMQVQSGVSEVVLAGGAESMSNAPFYSTAMRWGTGAGPGVMLHDALSRGRVTAGGRQLPGAWRHARDGGEPPPGVRHPPPGTGRVRRREPPAGGPGGRGRAASPTRSCPSSSRPARARWSSTGTSTSGPTPPWRNWPGCGRCSAGTTPTPPSPPATPRARTTGRRSASSPTPPGPTPSGCAPWPGSCPGVSAEWRRPRWASARSRPWPGPSTLADVALKDVDLIELNEAFAAQVLACTREWSFGTGDFDRLNVNGSGISLGHPVGATGGRILATLTREMARRDARYGLETMCIGGGQGLAALFERV